MRTTQIAYYNVYITHAIIITILCITRVCNVTESAQIEILVIFFVSFNEFIIIIIFCGIARVFTKTGFIH